MESRCDDLIRDRVVRDLSQPSVHDPTTPLALWFTNKHEEFAGRRGILQFHIDCTYSLVSPPPPTPPSSRYTRGPAQCLRAVWKVDHHDLRRPTTMAATLQEDAEIGSSKAVFGRNMHLLSSAVLDAMNCLVG